MLKCFRKNSKPLKFSNSLVSFLTLPPTTLLDDVPVKNVTTVALPAVRIRKALIRDVPKVLKLFRENFAKNEPLYDGLRMSSIDTGSFSPALEELWRNFIEQGMTLIAIPQKYRSAGEIPIFGAVINTKCCYWDADYLDKLSACVRCRKSSDLINLWALFMRESKIHEKFKVNSIFNIAHVIVNEKSSLDYSWKLDKSSLAKILVSMAIQLARSRGYDVASLTATSKRMSDIASSTGLDLVWEYPLDKLLKSDLNPIVKVEEPNSQVKVFATKLT